MGTMNTFKSFTEAKKDNNDPCWKDYKQVGMKKKNGKDVPNCVPEDSVKKSVAEGAYLKGSIESRADAHEDQADHHNSQAEKAHNAGDKLAASTHKAAARAHMKAASYFDKHLSKPAHLRPQAASGGASQAAHAATQKANQYNESTELDEARGYGKKPVSMMTKKEKDENDKRRSEYKAFQKAKRKEMGMEESSELDEIKLSDLKGNLKTDLKSLRKKLDKYGTDNGDARRKAAETAPEKKVAMPKGFRPSNKMRPSYAFESTEIQEGVIDQVKDIAAKKQAKKIDGVMVDLFTASAISQVYDAVNDANKAKMDKLSITKLADVAMKIMKRESVELEENKVDALAKDFHNRLKKAGNSDRNQNRERHTTLAKAKKQGLSPIEMKQLDGKMNAIMNKMDESVELDEVLDTPKAMQSYRDK